MQRIYIELFSLSLNLQGTTQRTIKRFNNLSKKPPKVSLIFFRLNVINFSERKTVVLDIDETLTYATTNRSELAIIDETIFIKMSRFGAAVKAFLSYRPFLF